MYIYYDNQGRVAMRTEEPLLKYGNLIEKKITISKADRDNFDGHLVKIEENGLTFEKLPRVKAKERTLLKKELKTKAAQKTLSLDDVLNYITLDLQ